MAKAKKQDTGAGGKKSAAKPQDAAKAGPKAKAPAAKKSDGGARAGSGGSLGVPLIDTSLAAEAAAKTVLHRAPGGAGGTGRSGASGGTGASAGTSTPTQPDAAGEGQDKRETSTFKQLKQSLSKPASQGLGGILGNVQGGKKSGQPFGSPQQQARNQTFGADVNRSGIPRRTGG